LKFLEFDHIGVKRQSAGVGILSLVGLILSALPVAAQQESTGLPKGSQRKFISEVDGFVGPSISWCGHVENQVPYYSYVFGFGISHRIGHRFEINPRVSAERKGSKTEYVSSIFGTPSKFVQGTKLDYLTATILLKCYLGKRQNFYGGLGGYFSDARKMKTYTEQYTLEGDLISNYYADIVDYKDYDFGLSANFGFKKQIKGKLGFNAQLLANAGLMDLYLDSFNNAESTRNYHIALIVGITFNP
jgi:hypothetical protein